jgi:glycosyltransferase involved in cell wall biosynthesis
MEQHKSKPRKVAIIHDWLIGVGGAEKVLSQLLIIYPDADIFCALDFLDDTNRNNLLQGKKATTTYLNKIPFAKKYYRFLIPLFYRSIEKLPLDGYDLIISSSHSIAKGVKSNSDQQHFCYCHTPMRYVWNMKKTYLESLPFFVKPFAMKQFKRLRTWDLENSNRVDHFIANSTFIASRIKNNYQRESTVIHPPVDDFFYRLPETPVPVAERESFFLVVSRLVNYKKIDLIVAAFNQMPNHKLVIIGAGPQSKKIKKMANSNITMLGYQSKDSVRHYLQEAQAIVVAAIEDFGITSLQAQACGTPVIALGYGGYLDSVIPNKTGVFFNQQTVPSLIEGIQKFENIKVNLDYLEIRKQAEKFGNELFRTKIQSFIETHYK